MAGQLGKETLSAGIAHINMGPHDTPFDAHLELLCDCSPYFDALYNERTQLEATGDPFSFPGEDPDVFAELIGWMYRGTLSPDLESRVRLLFLFKLWVLAAKFEIPALQNATMSLCEKRIENKASGLITGATVNYVYANTDPGSPPRQLVVGTWAEKGTAKQYSVHKHDFPCDILKDLCGELFSRIENAGLGSLKGCSPSVEQFAQFSKRKQSPGEGPFTQLGGGPGIASLATPEQV
ncbi:hypothetical protein BDV06DRAFT_228882 [Aspergillus oleicola]